MFAGVDSTASIVVNDIARSLIELVERDNLWPCCVTAIQLEGAVLFDIDAVRRHEFRQGSNDQT